MASAVLSGVKRSSGKVIAVLDGDGSHNPASLPSMIRLLSEYSIVVGSRYVAGGATEDYPVRQFLSRLFCMFARALLKLNVKDAMSGFIVAKREVFESVQLNPLGYKYALELLVKSAGKFRVAEYPIVFEKRKMGVSKTGVTTAMTTVALIGRLWLWRAVHGSPRPSVRHNA